MILVFPMSGLFAYSAISLISSIVAFSLHFSQSQFAVGILGVFYGEAMPCPLCLCLLHSKKHAARFILYILCGNKYRSVHFIFQGKSDSKSNVVTDILRLCCLVLLITLNCFIYHT